MEKEIIKEGDKVTCILVTGEDAIGTYSCTKPSTGSHLIENVSVDGGKKYAEFAWATSMEKMKAPDYDTN